MGFPASISPGNSKYQIGQSLDAIRSCAAAEDTEGMANQTRLLVALCSPYTDHAYAIEGETEEEVFECCMSIVEELLRVLTKNGLYAYIAAPYKDGSSLALQEDEIPDE